MSHKLAEVRVVAGPHWCQGKTGYYDAKTHHIYFEPQGEGEPTTETQFAFAASEYHCNFHRHTPKKPKKVPEVSGDAFHH